jgi:hypothetical protein
MGNISDTIVDLLTPVIGAGLATSAVTMQCKKMDILPEELNDENIEEFLKKIQKILDIFVGETVSSSIIQDILHIK